MARSEDLVDNSVRKSGVGGKGVDVCSAKGVRWETRAAERRERTFERRHDVLYTLVAKLENGGNDGDLVLV